MPDVYGWGPLFYFWRTAGAQSFVVRELEPRLVWSVGDYLLADVVDLLQGLCYGLAGRKGKKPQAIPRPQGGKKPQSAEVVDLNARLASIFKKA